MALIRPSAATYTNQTTVYSGTTKDWIQDMASLQPGQKRYPEPINRSLRAIAEWIDQVADSTTHKVDASKLTGSLPADTGLAILQAVYPVGCIYESTVATDPATTFGFGTWQAFGEGRVLVGVGTGFDAAATGGSADAVVVSHNHTVAYNPTGDGTQNQSATFLKWGGVDAGNLTLTASTEGVSGTGKNMPPYVVVYRWTRTA